MGQRVKSSDSEISPHLSGRARRPLNILTVDDHIDTLEILRMLLESEGFAVRTAEGVDEAALQLRQQLPDLIITDHLMPGTTGLAFCQWLRSCAETRHIPLILSTADDLTALETTCCNFVFQKPVDFEALLAAIRTF